MQLVSIKNKTRRIWLAALASALAATLSLSGCGGGGDSSPETSNSSTVRQIPSAGETEALLQKGAQLNVQELQAAAVKVEADPSSRGHWPSFLSNTPGTALATATSTPKRAAAKVLTKALSGVPVYRFYNKQTGAHFYTISEEERATVQNTLPQFQYDGPAFTVSPVMQSGLSPVYRFFNIQTGVHFYTISEDEKIHIQQTLPQFRLEGVAYFASMTAAAGWTELGRFYVPGKGFHFYTSSSMEATNTALFHGDVYRWEGFAYYVMGEDLSFGKYMFEKLNAARTHGGFGSLTRNDALENAAYAHGDYLLQNYHDGFYWDYASLSSIDPASGAYVVHSEASGLPGFTGVTPQDRAAHAGFSGGYLGEDVVLGEVNQSWGSYDGCIDGLINTVFHRDSLFNVNFVSFGGDVAISNFGTGYVCVIEPATSLTSVNLPADWVGIYPFSEQNGVPVSFSNEYPDPIPSSPIKGSPVSIYVKPGNQLIVTSFELRDSAGVLVPAKILTMADFPEYLDSSTVHLVPFSALKSNTSYTVRFVGSNAGALLTKTWAFMTQ